MTPASYAVVRYIADPGRNEPLNVGIVVWSERGVRLGVDERAVARVVRDHPHLDRDGLLYLPDQLSGQFRPDGAYSSGQVRETLATQRGYPVEFSEPRLVNLLDDSPRALDSAYEQLIARIVQPKTRSRGGGFNPVGVLEKRFKSYIYSHRIYRDHTFGNSRSGVPRSVDFYANSGANTAVDTIKLAISKGDEIVRRADAEAFKVEDVLHNESKMQFIVFCHVADDQEARMATEKAVKVLRSGGAQVSTDISRTGDLLEAALRSPTQ